MHVPRTNFVKEIKILEALPQRAFFSEKKNNLNYLNINIDVAPKQLFAL